MNLNLSKKLILSTVVFFCFAFIPRPTYSKYSFQISNKMPGELQCLLFATISPVARIIFTYLLKNIKKIIVFYFEGICF